MKNKFDPNVKDYDKNTPLNLAISYDYQGGYVVDHLLNAGADPNILNVKNQNSMFFIVDTVYYNPFKFLIKKNANVNQIDSNGMTPFAYYINKSPSAHRKFNNYSWEKAGARLNGY